MKCLNGGRCVTTAEGIFRCECNDSWINGPTFTGAKCEIPTADCSNGIWCIEGNGKCAMRTSRWAHGDGEKDCIEGGGQCHKQTMSAGTQDIEMCIGGTMNNVACNSATGCECFDGYFGSHCEEEIFVCEKSVTGAVTHWCNSRGSLGCGPEGSCACIDGYKGAHCTELVGLSEDPKGPLGMPRGAAIALGVIVPFVPLLTILLVFMYRRERKGNPLFKPYTEILLDIEVQEMQNAPQELGEDIKPEFTPPPVVPT